MSYKKRNVCAIRSFARTRTEGTQPWLSLKAAIAGWEHQERFDLPETDSEFELRRRAMFTMTAEEVALPIDCENRPFGVIIEGETPRGRSTIAAFWNGESRLFLGRGSGIIGRGSHPGIEVRAWRLVKSAADHVHLGKVAPAESDLAPGTTRFTFLTRQGRITIEEATDKLRNGQSPLAPLLEAGDVLTSQIVKHGSVEREVVEPGAKTRLKDFLLVAAFGAMTWVAWQIPSDGLRWAAVIVCISLTIAATILLLARTMTSR